MSPANFLDLESAAGRGASLLIGVLFGFWLERAGFGSSRKLAAIFYRRDFAVLKVMFSAMATAAVGLWLLESFGLIATAELFRPRTIWAPVVAGGLLFGVGFVMAGFCPGTALVGLGSGGLDALVFLVGASVGSLGFLAAWPWLENWMKLGDQGVLTWPDLLNLPTGVVAVAVVVIAVSAFWAADRWLLRPESGRSPS